MKRENFLFGCDGIKRFFSGLVSEGILSHAYLIEGPEGSGKKSLAKYIAASLACGKTVMNAISVIAYPKGTVRMSSSSPVRTGRKT